MVKNRRWEDLGIILESIVIVKKGQSRGEFERHARPREREREGIWWV